jgi:hypothetical protein
MYLLHMIIIIRHLGMYIYIYTYDLGDTMYLLHMINIIRHLGMYMYIYTYDLGDTMYLLHMINIIRHLGKWVSLIFTINCVYTYIYMHGYSYYICILISI